MKRVRILAALLAGLLVLVLVYAWYIKGGIAPQSAQAYAYDNCYEVEEELEEAGFSNIHLVPIDDEDMDEYPWLQMVAEVSIDGDTDFPEGRRYSSHVPVVVSYYQVPRKIIPVNSDELQNYAPQTLVRLFREAGFTNIRVREAVDLDPGTGLAFQNVVYLEEDDSFAQGQEYPRSIPILIETHYPLQEHRVQLHVSLQNPLRYSLILQLDHLPVLLQPENQEAREEWILTEGEHTLSVPGEEGTRQITFTVDADVVISCTLQDEEVVRLGQIRVDYPEEG